MAKKNALGRGLDALITFSEGESQGSTSIVEVELDKIAPNPDQPRSFFDQESLEELAMSISKIGIIKPITLRMESDGTYRIIAGERRYRASLIAGLTTIPAYVKAANDDELMEMALVENIQREDLNSIEIALAYQNLIDALSLTQEQLSERVGKKRATITNYLRLLKLPAEVQMGVKDKKIDMGHARALVTIHDPIAQLELYNQILEEGLSVRGVESLVREYSQDGTKSGKDKKAKPAKSTKIEDDVFDALKDHLSNYFKTDVKFSYNKSGKGRITIPFASPEELERIIGMFDLMKK